MADRGKMAQRKHEAELTKVTRFLDVKGLADAGTPSEIARLIERAKIAALEADPLPGLTYNSFGSVLEFNSNNFTVAPDTNLLDADDNSEVIVMSWGLDDSERPFADMVLQNMRAQVLFIDSDTQAEGDEGEVVDAIAILMRSVLEVGVKDGRHFQLPFAAILDSLYAFYWDGTTLVDCGVEIDGRRGLELPGVDTLTSLDPVYLRMVDPGVAGRAVSFNVGSWDASAKLFVHFHFEGPRR